MIQPLLLISLVITSTAADQHIDPKGVFARLNYGVIFRPIQPLRVITDEWTHVFVMQLPERYHDSDHIEHLRKFNCSEIHGLTATSCRNFLPLFSSLLTLHEISYRHVRSMIDHIYEILPDDLTYRRPPGLFDLWGKILNSLFGVATTDQLDALHATSDNAEAYQHWQKVTDTMTSFMEVTNHRLDNFASILRDHQTMLQSVSHSVSELHVDVDLLQALVASTIQNIARFVTALNDIDDIRIAIEGLAHGQLSPILLPPGILTRIFFLIYDDIANRSLEFNLKGHVHGDADFYHTHNFIAARRGSKLMIAFNFPLLRTFFLQILRYTNYSHFQSLSLEIIIFHTSANSQIFRMG